MESIIVSRPRILEEPQKRYTIGRIPHLESEWRSLADDLLEWAQQDSSVHLRDFAIQRGFPPSRLKNWHKHSEYFGEAFEIARAMICSRRETAAEQGKLAIPLFLSSFGMYDPEYKESIKSENAGAGNNVITVVEERIPDTGIPYPKDSDE